MSTWEHIARSMPLKRVEPRVVELAFHASAGVPTFCVTVVADPPSLRWRLQRRAQWCLEQVETVAPAVYWSLGIVERFVNLLEVRITKVPNPQPRL